MFQLSSPAPDVYRVDVRPAVATATTQVFSIRSDTTAIRLHADEGRVTIARFDSATEPMAWSGTILPISSFGRAAVPGLELSWTAKAGEAIYGAGERFNALNQAGRKVDFWIKDAPGQDGSATYYCTPVFYSSAGYGLFFTNNPEAFADFNSDGSGQHHYRRAGTSATFYIVIRPLIKEQINMRASIQGPYRSIPDWAWGPWISRNSYENQAEAEEAIRGMLDRGLPVAAIVQEAWKGRSETGEFNAFSKTRWPAVDDYLEFCNQHGIRNILWQVPIVHPSHPDFDGAAKAGYFVRKPDGSVSYRKEWLGGFANVDFTNPKARAYWKNQMREVLRFGVAGFKADDGEDIKPDDVFFDGRRGWEMHNEYSTLYNRTLTELLDELHIDGLLWSRSGSLGNETCPALWAGDQFASWDQLRSLLPAGLSASISGMPFWGHDIGGYMGQPSTELYIRWLPIGAFSPLMQYHGVKRREPWEFGPEAEAAYKLLANLRMELKPTLIQLGREAAETGMPIMRPMALEFPQDPRFASEQTQYMLGPDLLVAPVLDGGAPSRVVRFPAGRWQHLLRPEVYEGPADRAVSVDMVDAPVFVREGASLMSRTFDAGRVTVTNPPARTALGESQALARALFLARWSVAGPYPAEPRKAYATVFPPETNDPQVVWQEVPTRHLVDHEGLDFAALLGEHQHAAAYARTTLVSDREQEAELRFGSDDTLTVWLNGRQVHSVETYRSAELDQDLVEVHLDAGENSLLVKVAQDVGAWRLMFRITGLRGTVASGIESK